MNEIGLDIRHLLDLAINVQIASEQTMAFTASVARRRLLCTSIFAACTLCSLFTYTNKLFHLQLTGTVHPSTVPQYFFTISPLLSYQINPNKHPYPHQH
jgi:hypothetical protein